MCVYRSEFVHVVSVCVVLCNNFKKNALDWVRGIFCPV